MPMKRICLVPTDPENHDATWNITVDLFLNESGVPTDQMTAFGARVGVSPSSKEIGPFLLFTDGSLDFGTEDRAAGKGRHRILDYFLQPSALTHCPWRVAPRHGLLQQDRNRPSGTDNSVNQPEICPKREG